MLYFISVMINEDIPCLRLAYLLQSMVETLNENCNLPHQNPCSTREGAKHISQNTQYSFKNQRSMHGNDENILC